MTGKGTVHSSDGERTLDSVGAKLDVIYTLRDSGDTTLAVTSYSCPEMWERGAKYSPHLNQTCPHRHSHRLRTKWDEKREKNGTSCESMKVDDVIIPKLPVHIITNQINVS